jgi:hypothetical protein
MIAAYRSYFVIGVPGPFGKRPRACSPCLFLDRQLRNLRRPGERCALCPRCGASRSRDGSLRPSSEIP